MRRSTNNFESFTVTNANSFTCAAAEAAAKHLGKGYNPLMICGCARAGKTHLLHAIIQRASKLNKNARIAFFSAEQFADELADAIQSKQLAKFYELQLQNDLLLIDDMQFLAGEPILQRNFLQIFSALHEAKKQIAVTCNSSIGESQEIIEQINEQFEWGLIAELWRLDESDPSHESKVIPLISNCFPFR